MLVEQGAVQEADPPALGGLVDSPGMEEWRGHPGVSVGGGLCMPARGVWILSARQRGAKEGC